MAELRIKLEPDCFFTTFIIVELMGAPFFRNPPTTSIFLSLYDKYISPVADTYAWVLMGNHFHLLVRIKNPR